MKKKLIKEAIERAGKIKLLLMDCDGVLTDGRLYYSEKGEELKVFNVKDGQGIVMWHRAGLKSGIISGRDSGIVSVRAIELGINYIKVGSQDKVKDFDEMLEEARLKAEEVAYIGDDLPDMNLMKKVGFSIAVNDAVQKVVDEADYVTQINGGFGAVREVIDFLLDVKSSQSLQNKG